MKLLFKQRLFSWFDSYDIYDEAGNTVYVVKGQFSWGHKLAIYDAYGNEVGMVVQKVLTFLPKFEICITKISTFLILCDLAVCLATLYVSFSLVFALMRYLQGKVFLIRFYSPTTLSSSRAEFRLPSRLACA